MVTASRYDRTAERPDQGPVQDMGRVGPSFAQAFEGGQAFGEALFEDGEVFGGYGPMPESGLKLVPVVTYWSLGSKSPLA